jgi:hypothetical protein
MPFLLFPSLPFHLLKKALDLGDFAEHPPTSGIEAAIWRSPGGYLAETRRGFGGHLAGIRPLRSVTMNMSPGQGR